MGVGNIFVATTLAPLVIVLASISLQLLTIGLEKLKECECSLDPKPWVGAVGTEKRPHRHPPVASQRVLFCSSPCPNWHPV